MEAEAAESTLRSLQITMTYIHLTDRESAITTACLVEHNTNLLQQSYGLITRKMAGIERSCNMLLQMQGPRPTEQSGEVDMHPAWTDDDDDVGQAPPDHFQEEPDSWLDEFELLPPPDGGGNLN